MPPALQKGVLSTVAWLALAHSSSGFAETGPLETFGRPTGFHDAAKPTLGGLAMPAAYGLVTGEEGESNEIWVLETDAGFESAMAEVFNWLSKNKLAVLDGECYSQQNQQCEINAAGEGVVRLGMQLADEKRNGNKRLLIIRAEGPAKNPD